MRLLKPCERREETAVPKPVPRVLQRDGRILHVNLGVSEVGQRLFLLPAGEGQDEGERPPTPAPADTVLIESL
jgi:hypothetical protein